jgi:hypothetical protein
MAKFPPKSSGDSLFASEYNNVQLPREDVLNTSGITGVNGDNTQLSKAVANYAARSQFYTDAGIADAYVLNAVDSYRSITGYQPGVHARFVAGNSNTGVSTINVTSLGVVPLRRIDGAAIRELVAGDIVAGGYYEITYSGSEFLLTFGTASSKDIGIVDGTVPLIGVGDKLSSSLLEDATETVKGIAEVATQAETDAGILDNKIVTPLKLSNAANALETVKGWVNFTGVGTVTINNSFNVSSVVDLGSGRYRINWDVNFSTGNYAVVATTSPDVGTVSLVAGLPQNGLPNSSFVDIETWINTQTPSLIDGRRVFVAAFGDQ